ncbi:B9T54_RS14040 family protein [Leptospira alstonii]|uniref:Uncharacterized protein n=1 Tax=Leptospira alstonii serovar Sichuan str. 79601 TaxID=1218565 RepID=M6CUW3_9LEPT|nr:hypothetical protein [Leptospira alstonii]AGS80492.1 hypothetical protein LEP1GSC193_0787 [Leptospira phage vB_LalZ_80412-LE1]EMJ95484.1 hypothetical protein LEP1GSC194_3587 [Leptospira alstonii serovar Sichuan str. 79601]
MISYKELKHNITPVSFNEIDFDILEQHLNIRIDDFTRECVRKSDHLRKILAMRPAIFNKATDFTSLEYYKE